MRRKNANATTKEIIAITVNTIENKTANKIENKSENKIENQNYLKAPDIIKAVYITSWSASSKNYINYLINLSETSEINSVVVDIKDWSGYIGYDTNVPEAEKYGAESARIRNIDEFVKNLHDKGIYVIGRIAIFQDPILARVRPDLAVQSRFSSSLWLDRKGLAWIDPASKEGWDYNIKIAKDALSHGFDEINFDYVRFPSDGNLQDMIFPVWDGKNPKNLIIKEFFKYLRQELPNAKLSVDLFGLSTVNKDDMGIGQVIEDSFEYFDYVSPMVYPSHYDSGFLGFEKPAEHPYEVVKYSMDKAQERLAKYNAEQGISMETKAKIRPWLQDFNLGAVYDADMVKAQIRAVFDATGEDFSGFMLWNPSNVYTKESIIK